MQLRTPSIDPGVRAFLWALTLALFLFLFLLGVGTEKGTAFVLSLVFFGGVFLYIRLYGGDARA